MSAREVFKTIDFRQVNRICIILDFRNPFNYSTKISTFSIFNSNVMSVLWSSVDYGITELWQWELKQRAAKCGVKWLSSHYYHFSFVLKCEETWEMLIQWIILDFTYAFNEHFVLYSEWHYIHIPTTGRWLGWVNLSEKSCSPQVSFPVPVSGSRPCARSPSFVFLPGPAAVSDPIETSPAANQQCNSLHIRQFQFIKK